jgi:putative tricarboxylic transport membrane protein
VTAPDGTGRPDASSRPDAPSLLLAGLLLVMGVTVLVDAAGVEAPPGGGVVGPAAFMWAIGGALLVLGAVLGLVALRGRADEELAANPLVAPAPLDDTGSDGQPEADGSARADDGAASVRVAEDEPAAGEPRPFLRARPAVRVALLLGGLLVHAAIISTAGYIVAAAVLFVTTALAFGAPRLLPPVLIGTVLAAVIFYAFTLGLGLGLPYLGGG